MSASRKRFRDVLPLRRSGDTIAAVQVRPIIAPMLRSACALSLAVLAVLPAPVDAAEDAAPVVIQAPMPAAPPTAVPEMPDLVLLPGDEILIQVYDNPDLERVMRASGAASDFPLIGSIGPLAGMSPRQIGDQITKALADGYLRRRAVTVSVRRFVPRTVAVLGCVRVPTRLEIDPQSSISALQALAQAGGTLDDADQSHMVILRENPRTGVGGEVVPLVRASGAGIPVDDIRLRPGDTIVVPRFDRAFVIGAVARPGPVQIESEKPTSVAKAISVAGGFQRFARTAKVQLLRDGGAQTIDVDAILNGKGGEDPRLKPGDVVFVPESIF